MPMYYYRCPKPGCDTVVRKILLVEEAKRGWPCPDCETIMVRAPQPPSTRVTETLDNGLMTKRLERLADAERLFGERAAVVKKKQEGGD